MTDYARLRPLIGATSMDVDAMLHAMLERLDNMDVGGIVRITLLTDAGPQKWALDLSTKQSVPETDRDVDLELIMSAATWTEIALGRLAPLEAFGASRLRLRGDADLANRLYERLKDGGGVTSVCR